jgi:hypothetical protein
MELSSLATARQLEFLAAVEKHGSENAAARALGVNARTVQRSLRSLEMLAARQASAPIAQQKLSPAKPDFDLPILRDALRKSPMTAEGIAERFGISRARAEVALEDLQQQGLDVQEFGGRFSIGKAAPAPRHERGLEIPEYHSRPDGTYIFGFTSDNHLCSKYSRLDVLNDLYDQFAAQGVDRVLNAGNWIDGEARFNMHDLLVHGMDAQLKYLADNYPTRPGLVTYAVAGDDHEGWYCQREGVDIGRYAQNVMREAGRNDWVDMGYMESYVRLVNSQSGESTMLHLMHPGGGSSYAVSYTVQKIVEGYDGGDKPAVLLAGHTTRCPITWRATSTRSRPAQPRTRRHSCVRRSSRRTSAAEFVGSHKTPKPGRSSLAAWSFSTISCARSTTTAGTWQATCGTQIALRWLDRLMAK